MAMLDTILVYPKPTEDSPVKGPALSIFYVGAQVEGEGYSVEYVDERFDGTNRLKELVKKYEPLTVGVSTMTGVQLREVCRILKWIKNNYPRIFTIAGGVHPTLMAEQMIREPYVDFVVKGEGEATFSELLHQIKGNRDFYAVKGIVWKENGNAVFNDDRPFMKPEEWPFPMTKKNFYYFKKAAESN